jgi:hypothetical protein
VLLETIRKGGNRMFRHCRFAVLSVAFVGPILACGYANFPADKSRADTVGHTAQSGGGVSFANDIQPIFDNRCNAVCHNPVAFLGMLDLTADNAYNNLVNVPTSPGCMQQVPDSVRVVPFDTQSSMLWLKTMPDPGRCGRPMPFGTDGLGVIAPDEFALIDAWITEGAPNN